MKKITRMEKIEMNAQVPLCSKSPKVQIRMKPMPPSIFLTKNLRWIHTRSRGTPKEKMSFEGEKSDLGFRTKKNKKRMIKTRCCVYKLDRLARAKTWSLE